MSALVRESRVAYLGPDDGVPDAGGAEVVDATGATIVPGLVDCHAHFTGLGGANWIARFGDPEAELLARGDDAARDLVRMGVLTARDVGAPRRLNLRIRDKLRGRPDAPEILAAGTWLARRDKFPPFVVFVDSGEELRRAAVAEIDAGADLVKIAVDTGRLGHEVTFTVDELAPTVDAVHARGKRITAHAQGRGAAVAAAAGVDSIEHGFGVDAATAQRMSGRTTLVTTLSVLESFIGFASTAGGRFEETRDASAALLEQAFAAVRAANSARVRIATGSDFGGGSVRPGHLAWEVELLVRAGLEPYEALASATWVGGELLGVAHAGTISEGGTASLVLVHGDPLSDPAALWRVWRVYHRGVRVK
ncbi:MAG TPA: amidohydrolase family protein [Candidatus Limnocylindria bacterium]|nr:amidohydrolase family protein [Candidatus Limnocylindria bacterium]